ncbi:hypothetical protein CC86DRAFT_67563 [Ophiobolus disseminans]|uniref:Zn(2)-C6 fungal-type domain-containing protein n=1 Tax=Ophiobolus disseminans TaxID=1469910 RepID=A0A6A6ZSJ6_9PLEO|nr:hypothetical protein CC86DRAFT_67563 [Ophiobolus disseminans]
MASSTPRKPRGSRKGEIPHNFILKWQSSGPKPLVRRPMTACQACRTGKVKCDNQPQCDRCTSRNIICRYTNIGALDTPPQTEPSSTTDIASPIAATQTTPEEIAIDLDMTNASNCLSMDAAAYDEAFDDMAGWTPNADQQALNDFAWPPMNTDLNVEYFSNAADTIHHIPTCSPKDQNLTAAAPLLPTTLGSVITMAPTNGLSQPSQLLSLPKCQCRESLVTLNRRVTAAMQEKQLDNVFKGMQRVVEGFQDIVHCSACDITCVDLVCIMAVFQQTSRGFEYLVKADMVSVINMTFGGCEVAIHDPKLRAMLVTSLIHQATDVLDAIKAKGQHMLGKLCTPSAMAHANIRHLETVIGEFRNVLCSMADVADRAASPPKQASSTSEAQMTGTQVY